MARKAGLAADDVLDAAIAIADRDGLEGVTLISVARALDVRSPSLYSHVEGLDGLRRALALRAATDLTDALTAAVRDHSGMAALRQIAVAYRRFAKRHPGLYAAVQRAVDRRRDPELYDALLAAVGPVMQALAQAGVTDVSEQIHATRVFRSALHGFVTLEQLGGFGLPEDVNTTFDRLVALIVRGVAG
jgi:AcrR family transcriptional regulator